MGIGGEAVNSRLHLLMHQVAADRLLHGELPEDRLAFGALLERGVDAHEAQHAIGRRFVEELIAQLGPPPGHEPAPGRARVRGAVALASAAGPSAPRGVATAAEQRPHSG